MNEIVLLTERGFYCGGETVYGAVFIDICKPTGACGFDLTITSYKSVYLNNDNANTIKKKPYHAMYTLFQQDEPISIGSYVLPFQLCLPEYLPSTFYYENSSDSDLEMETPECQSWRVSVSHILRVKAKRASSLKCRLPLVIFQHLTDQSDSFEPVSVKGVLGVTQFPSMRKGELVLRARLNKPVFEFGENITLSMELSNDTRKSIEHIALRLKRRIRLRLAADPSDKRRAVSVLWGLMMPGSEPEVSKRGFDDLSVTVPLPTEHDFTPSLQCDLVECQHYIEISVLLEGDRNLMVEIPVRNVLPNDNEAWSNWRAPVWIDFCKLMNTNRPVNVDPHILLSSHFSAMPVFRNLNSKQISEALFNSA